MAEIDASKNATTGDTLDLDETRSYNVICTSGGTMAVDGGEAVSISAQTTNLVVGPGVGKLVFGGSYAGGVIPRSDSRM